MRFLFLIIAITTATCFTACNNGKVSENDHQDPSANGQTETNKPDSILTALNKRITENPNDYLNYLDRARYFGEKENFNEAFQDIARALAVDSTKADIYLFKGELFFDQGKVKEAYEEYKSCVGFDPTNSDCILKKTGIDIVLGNYDLAKSQINDALKFNEFNPYAYYMRGRLYKTTGDTLLAASSYKTAIEVDPNYYDAYIEVGLLYASQKNELAKEYYNSAIDIRPKSIEALYNKAMFLQENGAKKKSRYNEAFQCYDAILKIDPGFVAAYFNKGFIQLEYKQQYDSAAVYFTQAIGYFPEYYQAYYNRGLCNESMKKRKEAESDYRSALALKPDYDDAAIALDRLLRTK